VRLATQALQEGLAALLAVTSPIPCPYTSLTMTAAGYPNPMLVVLCHRQGAVITSPDRSWRYYAVLAYEHDGPRTELWWGAKALDKPVLQLRISLTNPQWSAGQLLALCTLIAAPSRPEFRLSSAAPQSGSADPVGLSLAEFLAQTPTDVLAGAWHQTVADAPEWLLHVCGGLGQS
jgi:hypothetical protein